MLAPLPLISFLRKASLHRCGELVPKNTESMVGYLKHFAPMQEGLRLSRKKSLLAVL
jgi:hypothetical protein